MPVVRDVRLTLETSNVLRRQGVREYSKLKSEIETITNELLIIVNNDSLLEPAIAYETYPVIEVGHQQISLEGSIVLHGAILPLVLGEAEEVAVAVCTVGPRLEGKVTDYFNGGESLRGLLLDGIGSAAVDTLSSELCQLMSAEASLRGYQVSSPLCPGGPTFPLSEQWQLFELVPAEEIGVSLTSSGVMVPRKSLSMVIGMGPQMRSWTKVESCAHCNLRETCRYRLHA